MEFSRVTLIFTSSYPGVKKNPISETNSDYIMKWSTMEVKTQLVY